MTNHTEHYNNHDIRIGALSSVQVDIRVNCNYVLDSVKEYLEHLKDCGDNEIQPLEWQLLYIETLNNDQSEAFWCDFNYNIFAEEWSKDINIINGGGLNIGYSGDDEWEVFSEMINHLFYDDNDIGGEWGFDSQEAKEEFIAKFKKMNEKELIGVMPDGTTPVYMK